MRRIMLPVCSLLLVALSVACGSGGDEERTEAGAGGGGGWAPPDGPADIAGPLASVTTATGGECGDVGSDPDAPASSDDPDACERSAADGPTTVIIEKGAGRFEAAAVTLSDQTELRRRTGSSYAEAEVPDLAVGTRVEVWFDGPVAESFPVQGRAGTVIIIG
jgi:hypothetical protein